MLLEKRGRQNAIMECPGPSIHSPQTAAPRTARDNGSDGQGGKGGVTEHRKEGIGEFQLASGTFF